MFNPTRNIIISTCFFLFMLGKPVQVFTQNQEVQDINAPPAYLEQNFYPYRKKPAAFSLYQPSYFLMYPMPAKIQFSFKINILHNSKSTNDSGLYGAYTHLALMELFQSKKHYSSNPIVDINFMPEVFYLFSPREIIPWFSLQTGFQHISNGQGGWETYKSVSTNQIYIEPQFHAYFWGGYLKSTIRFFVPADIRGNPRLLDYLGFFEANVSYRTTLFQHTTGLGIEMMFRKGLKSYYGTFALRIAVGPFFFKNTSIPLAFFAELWSGYGEALYLYNQGYTKIRFGFSVPMY